MGMMERSDSFTLLNPWQFQHSIIPTKGRKRPVAIIIDTTLHASVGEKMENLLVMSTRQNKRRSDGLVYTGKWPTRGDGAPDDNACS